MIVGRFRHLFHIYLFVCGKKLGYFSFILVATDLNPHIKISRIPAMLLDWAGHNSNDESAVYILQASLSVLYRYC